MKQSMIQKMRSSFHELLEKENTPFLEYWRHLKCLLVNDDVTKDEKCTRRVSSWLFDIFRHDDVIFQKVSALKNKENATSLPPVLLKGSNKNNRALSEIYSEFFLTIGRNITTTSVSILEFD